MSANHYKRQEELEYQWKYEVIGNIDANYEEFKGLKTHVETGDKY